jgi:hypothetical protein
MFFISQKSLRAVGGAVLHARLDLLTADPNVLGECIQYIQGEMRPAAESQPGSLGLSLLASPELGSAVLESFWASDHALWAGGKTAATVRGELARRAGGSMTVEEYRVAVFEREAPLRGGEGSGWRGSRSGRQRLTTSSRRSGTRQSRCSPSTPASSACCCSPTRLPGSRSARQCGATLRRGRQARASQR